MTQRLALRFTQPASAPVRPAQKGRRGARCLLLVLALLVGLPLPAQAQSAGDPLVLAFYYPWFDNNTWSYDTLSDLPAEPYVSADRGVMGRQIDQAKAAGIDAFLVAWYGPGGGNQTEPNLAALLEEAGARNFKIGVLFETTSPFFGGSGDAQAALQHLQNSHVNHPAFLRVDGRPVVFFWRPTLYSVETWRAIRAAVDPNFSQIWISEGVDTAYLAIFDGHHLYSNTWNPPADLNAVNQKFAARVAAARASGAYKFWVATVMPGYDDVKIRGGGGFARGREDGNYFAQSWQAAIASRPNWIVINSFNEWPEGSYIEPSAAFGDRYLGLAASYSAQFKSGGSLAVAAALPAPLPPPPTPTPTPPPTVPTAYVNIALLNLRSGPSTDEAIVGQVSNGTALPISGRHAEHPDWWQVSSADGSAWVYAPLVTTGGPMEQVAQLTDAALPAQPATPEPLISAAAPAPPTQPASTERALPSPPLDPNFDSLLPALAR
jgi:hypothetical protein